MVHPSPLHYLSFFVGPWSNGCQCGMRIPRPGFNSQYVYKPSLFIIIEDKYGLSFVFLKVATDDEASRNMVEEAAKNVSAELGSMLSLVQSGAISDLVIVANSELLNHIGNPDEMKELATLFDQAYSRIVDAVRANIDAIDDDDKSDLLNAAKRLSDLINFELLVGQVG